MKPMSVISIQTVVTGPDGSLRGAAYLPGTDIPADIREAADALLEKDRVESILRFALLPPLDFDEAAAVPIGAAADPGPIREMEAVWEAAWGTTLAAAR